MTKNFNTFDDPIQPYFLISHPLWNPPQKKQICKKFYLSVLSTCIRKLIPKINLFPHTPQKTPG